jgi:ribose transport system substrate-binding protein
MYTRREAMLLPALGAGSCNRSKQPVIGVVPKATSHLFFVAVHAGVRKAAHDNQVRVQWNGPQEETDYGRQIQIVDSMLAQRVDGLAISATDERALAATVERVIRAGIPVTIFDSSVNVQDYVTFVATDNYGAGVTAARILGRSCGPAGKIAMVMHKPGGTSTVYREQGFQETLAKEFPGVRIAARQYGMADTARSLAAAENILTANPDLAGIFASSEASSIGSIQALIARGLSGKIKLVTFDTSDAHIDALRNGTIDTMLVQDAFRIGYEAVRSLAEKLKGGTPERRIDLPAREIRKADMDKPEVMALLKPKVD